MVVQLRENRAGNSQPRLIILNCQSVARLHVLYVPGTCRGHCRLMVVQLRENRARTFWPVVVSRWVYARVVLGD
jgi:hypothetical protein